MVSMYETFGFAMASAESGFSQINIKRNLPGEDDVQFELKYCGICHTDVHFAKNEMGSTQYPIVPGHELAGVVTKVGKNVKKVKVGDHVGVGCISDSCMNCKKCEIGEEQFCAKGMTSTYNSATTHGHIATDSGYTYGGYSGSNTVNQKYIVKIPEGYPLQAAGPVLCAGITMFSPLLHWKADSGELRVGIIGIGGLGQMGVKIAAAMGNKVTAISTSPNKEAIAKEIGASTFVVSSSEESMKAAAGSLDLILNTVSADHQIAQYLPLLDRDGTIVQLGVVKTPHAVSQRLLLFKRIKISGSLIGGMVDTQKCIDFCAKHNIIPITNLIKQDKLTEVYDTLSTKNDQVVRYVLDVQASKK